MLDMVAMKDNVVILTTGLSGSSVLTGLIARAGYWPGDSTHKKEYDTFENQELVKLNKALIDDAGFKGDYMTQFSPEAIRRVSTIDATAGKDRYRMFINTCDGHRPWIWKDPR